MPDDTVYAVIDAPGYYGFETTVWATFPTPREALAYRSKIPVQVIAGSNLTRGKKIGSGVLADMLATGLWRVVRG